MMNCKQVTRLLSDSQERKLTFIEKTSLRMHTTMCSGCRNFGKQMGIIRNISHKYAHTDKRKNEHE